MRQLTQTKASQVELRNRLDLNCKQDHKAPRMVHRKGKDEGAHQKRANNVTMTVDSTRVQGLSIAEQKMQFIFQESLRKSGSRLTI